MYVATFIDVKSTHILTQEYVIKTEEFENQQLIQNVVLNETVIYGRVW